MNLVSDLILYRHPSAQRRSSVYELIADGEKVDVLHAEKADFAVFECDGNVELAVASHTSLEGAVVKPARLGIPAEVEANRVRFMAEGPCCICLDVPGSKPLFIYINAIEENKPSPSDPGVHYFAAGQVHNIGKLELKSGETLYLEGGSVLRGNIICSDARNVKICGAGILDGSYYDYARGNRVRSIIFERCHNVSIRNIIMIEPTSWMLVLGRCENVHVSELKQIGSCMSSDGIDICGSSHVLIENCCLRNDDDNIAIKSVSYPNRFDWTGNVENVRVRRCTFLNGTPGNVMEIGYELRADFVRDIVFEDIDVLNAHGEGAVFSIHNGDRARVENIRWENIRVEHYWEKLIDFRVVFASYNRDAQRGSIANIHLKNIQVANSIFNPGCSFSLISGFRPHTPIRNVLLEGIFLNGVKVLSADELDLHTRNAEEIRFS